MAKRKTYCTQALTPEQCSRLPLSMKVVGDTANVKEVFLSWFIRASSGKIECGGLEMYSPKKLTPFAVHPKEKAMADKLANEIHQARYCKKP